MSRRSFRRPRRPHGLIEVHPVNEDRKGWRSDRRRYSRRLQIRRANQNRPRPAASHRFLLAKAMCEQPLNAPTRGRDAPEISHGKFPFFRVQARHHNGEVAGCKNFAFSTSYATSNAWKGILDQDEDDEDTTTAARKTRALEFRALSSSYEDHYAFYQGRGSTKSVNYELTQGCSKIGFHG